MSVSPPKATGSIPRFERFAAVVEISEFGESPRVAIRSVLDHASYFVELHVVQYAFSKRDALYAGWDKDVAQLKAAGLEPIWHSTFDPNRVTEARAIVPITADLQVGAAAMAALHGDMVRSAKDAPAYTHFAVTSITSIKSNAAPIRGKLTWKGALAWASDVGRSLSYGFLLVVMMLDWWRTLYGLGKYHRTHDLRGEALSMTYPLRVQRPARPWLMTWIWDRTTARAPYGGSALMHTPAHTGLSFVLRTIKTHAAMGVGWWIVGFAIYYWLFAWPWWTPYMQPYKSWRIVAVLARNPWAWYWHTLYVVHTFVVGCVAWLYMDFPALTLQVGLYTLYLTLCPPLLLYGRFHASRASWKHRKARKGD